MTIAFLFVGLIFVPVVDGINHSQTETVTVEHEVGYNSMDPYSVSYSDVRGDIAPVYECIRGEFSTSTWEFTPDSSGTWVKAPLKLAVDGLTFHVAKGKPFYFSNIQAGFNYNGQAGVYSHDWSILVKPNPDDSEIGDITVTQAGSGDYYMYVLYNVSYNTYTDVPYNDNTARSPTIQTEYGTMSGTTFTPDASGDYISIPLKLLKNMGNNSTFKVQDGVTIYAADTSGDLASFIFLGVPSSGMNSALRLQFAVDNTIAPVGGVYTVKGVNTSNVGLPNLIIPKDINTGDGTGTVTYTNANTTDTVSDTRANGGSTAVVPSGPYLLVQPESLNAGYSYTVGYGSKIYYPDTVNVLRSYTFDGNAPSNMRSGLTLTFTPDAQNPDIYTMTGTCTDLGAKGVEVLYTTTVVVATLHDFGNNGLYQSAAQTFTPNENGNAIKVPGIVLGDDNTYYTNAQYYGEVSGTLVQILANNPQGVDGMELTITEDSGVYSITGEGTGYIIVPYSYANAEDQVQYNDVDTYSHTWTPVRGNMAGDLFTPDVDGTYMKVYEYNIEQSDYQIGDGKTYYATIGGTTASFVVPFMPAEGITMDFTVSSEDEHVYDIDCTPTSDSDTLVIPYAISWTETTTEYVEVIPLAPIAIIAAILMCIMIGVSAVVKGGKF